MKNLTGVTAKTIRSLVGVGLLTTIVAGCDDSPDTYSKGDATFSPAAGAIASSVNVSISVPEGATNIRVTSNGLDPSADCLVFDVTENQVPVSMAAVVKVRYQLDGSFMRTQQITAARERPI